MFEDIDKETLIKILQRFVPTRYHDLNNWEIIIKRAKIIEDKYYAFRCSFQTIYLNKNYEPVNYDRQHIINGDYYYDYDEGEPGGAGTYTYIISVKKKKAEDLLSELEEDDIDDDGELL